MYEDALRRTEQWHHMMASTARTIGEVLRQTLRFCLCEHVGLIPRGWVVPPIKVREPLARGVLDSKSARDFNDGPRG
jgi:hypothetical protein